MTDTPEKPDNINEENFLARWSRRKTAASAATEQQTESITEPAQQEEEAVDPANLPPIDSLTADSDFTIFMKKGVPPGLRAAALRKLWLTEPSVVSYKPLVEYNWDFTAPGYGELLPSDDVVKFARTVLEGSGGTPVVEQSSDHPAEVAPQDGTAAVPRMQDSAREPADIEAGPDRHGSKNEIEPVQPETVSRRRHGGALPR